MSKIKLKIINATCGGMSCDNYRFKLCYAAKGEHPKCLDVYDTSSPNGEVVQYQTLDTVLKTFWGIVLTALPYSFIVYINDEKLYNTRDNRPQNETNIVLTLNSDTDTRSFMQIELTSECYDKDHCFGFLCQDCFTKPPIVTVPDSKIGSIGWNLTIPCNVSKVYSGTEITWIKNNGSFDTIINIDESERFVGGTYNIPDLTIMSAQKEDEGNYTCQAQTLEFHGSSQPVYLSIFEYPVVNVSSIKPAIAGTNITIQCYVSPTSEVTRITWYKNNSILDIYGDNRFSGGTISSPSLEIYFIEEYDEGNYSCQATNPVGTNESISTHLTILPDIPIVHISRIEAVNVGENVIISCNIASVSELTKVVWSKNNIEFNLNTNRTKYDDRFSAGTLQDPSLTINSVQITDEGNYTCNATNDAEQTGWSNTVHLSVFEATTESLPTTGSLLTTESLPTTESLTTTDTLPTTDPIFPTSELSTSSSDIFSTDFIVPTSDLTTLMSDTMPSKIETTKPSTMSSSVKTTITTTSANVPSIIETTKPSTVPSSIKTSISTTSTHVPSTKSSNSPSTKKPFDTVSSTLTSTRKSTTSPFSSTPPSTVMSTVRPTTIFTSASSGSNLPTHTVGSKPPTKIPYSSSTVKISTKASSTSEYPVSSAGAVGSTQANSENLNAWVITTTVICVVEFIVIVLVVYILWLRKQRRLAMQYEKEETAF